MSALLAAGIFLIGFGLGGLVAIASIAASQARGLRNSQAKHSNPPRLHGPLTHYVGEYVILGGVQYRYDRALGSYVSNKR